MTWISVLLVVFTFGGWFLKWRDRQKLLQAAADHEEPRRRLAERTIHGKRYRVEKIIMATAASDTRGRDEDRMDRPDPHRLVVTIEDVFPSWVRFGWSPSAYGSPNDRNRMWMDILFADASEDLIVEGATIYSDKGSLVFETAIEREAHGTESFLLFAGAYLQKKLDLVAEVAKQTAPMAGNRTITALRVLAEHQPNHELTLAALQRGRSALDSEVRATALELSDYAASRAALIELAHERSTPAALIAIRALIRNKDHAALLELPGRVASSVAAEYLESLPPRDPRVEAIAIGYLRTPARDVAARILSRAGGRDALAALRVELAKKTADAKAEPLEVAIETIEDRLRAKHGDTTGGLSMVEAGPEGGLSFAQSEGGALSIRKESPPDDGE